TRWRPSMPSPRSSPASSGRSRPLVDRTFVGVPASPGIVVGSVHLLRWEVPLVRHRVIEDAEIPREIARLHAAFTGAIERLEQIRKQAEQRAGADEAAIFDAQILMLQDSMLIGEVESNIRQKYAAEKAFDLVMVEHAQQFARHAQPRLRERV